MTPRRTNEWFEGREFLLDKVEDEVDSVPDADDLNRKEQPSSLEEET
jgi:hypothetical protein